MLRCNEVTRLYASEEVRHAPWPKRVAFRLHLMMCRSCQRYVQEVSSIGEAVRGVAQETPEDAERMESIVQRVLKEASRPDS